MGGVLHCEMRKSESDLFGPSFSNVDILNIVIFCFYVAKEWRTFQVMELTNATGIRLILCYVIMIVIMRNMYFFPNPEGK